MTKFLITICALTILPLISAQITGTATDSANGGKDITFSASKTLDSGLGGSIFTSGNTLGGPVTTGGALSYNNDPLGLSLSKTYTSDVGSTLTGAGNLNLIDNPSHRLDANAYHSRTSLNIGFDYSQTGGGLDYLNKPTGLGAGLGVSHIPQLDKTTVDLTGRWNILNSESTSLDAIGKVSKSFDGKDNGKTDAGVGLELKHRF